MRYIGYVVLGTLAVILVTVALANREPLTIRLLPEVLSGLFGFSWQLTLPAFAILLIAVLFGVVLGFVWEWIREHKHRAAAASERRKRQKLEVEVRKVSPSSDKGDDVLALLEGR